MAEIPHTGFGGCGCKDCWPDDPIGCSACIRFYGEPCDLENCCGGRNSKGEPTVRASLRDAARELYDQAAEKCGNPTPADVYDLLHPFFGSNRDNSNPVMSEFVQPPEADSDVCHNSDAASSRCCATCGNRVPARRYLYAVPPVHALRDLCLDCAWRLSEHNR